MKNRLDFTLDSYRSYVVCSLGAGLNIASKLGRATFGKGSGAKLLKNAKGRAKNTKDKFLNTKLGGKAKSFKDNASKHGLAGLGAQSIKHGMARANNLRKNIQECLNSVAKYGFM